MRTILLSFLFFVPLMGGAAYATKTCTAPGHPTCTITCPNGCIAGYTEPNGPCRTMCSGSAATPDAATMSVGASGLSLKELQETLADPETKMQEMK